MIQFDYGNIFQMGGPPPTRWWFSDFYGCVFLLQVVEVLIWVDIQNLDVSLVGDFLLVVFLKIVKWPLNHCLDQVPSLTNPILRKWEDTNFQDLSHQLMRWIESVEDTHTHTLYVYIRGKQLVAMEKKPPKIRDLTQSVAISIEQYASWDCFFRFCLHRIVGSKAMHG